jgi:hypothetical protein
MSLAMVFVMTSEMAPLASAQTPPPAPPAQQKAQGQQPQTQKQQNYSRAPRQEKRGIVH